MNKNIKSLKNVISLIIGVAMVITGIIIMTVSDSHAGYGGGVSRASTSIEFGADFYTSSAQYTGLAANAVADLFELVQNCFGFVFIFAGLLVICKEVFILLPIFVKETSEETSQDTSAIPTPNENNVEYREPSKNEWKCPKCGKNNNIYITTCGCGEEKPNE